MTLKCPGQDSRNLKVEKITCSNCGYDVEIFSDENRVKCPKCRKMVGRKRLPSCVDWCKAAPACVGEEKWNQLKKK
jgi:DNA-directed RNA polymerase subunit RPC12/RpoP